MVRIDEARDGEDLLTANLCGIFAGEWRYSRAVERVLMGLGLLVLILAIITLGWSGTLS